MIALAEPLAKLHHFKRSREGAHFESYFSVNRFLQQGFADTDGDFEKTRTTLEYIDPPDRQQLTKSLLGVADEILKQNWPSVRRLAQLLLKRGILGTEKLMRFSDTHRVQRYEGLLTPR